ncbi:MAG TPA: methyltransferase domain-containing protein [Vicinamibacteria bacterium]|jgi:ubiquinone/menaquinone biosynthesis C-methylase UbiE
MNSLALVFFLLLQHHQGPQHTFEDAGRWVQEFEDPSRDAWQKPDEVVGAMALEKGDRVADVGAGSGYFTRRFARAVGETGVVYAVDIEPNMLRHIAQRATEDEQSNIVPVLARPDNPMLAPGSVDVIFICDTIHHIENRPSYYQVLKRDLAPGGRIVIVDFLKKEDVPVGPPMEMKIAKQDLIAELVAAGFRLKAERDFLPYQYFLILERS